MLVGDNIEVGVIHGENNAGAAAGGLLHLGLARSIGTKAVKVAAHLLHGDVGDGHYAGQGALRHVGDVHAVACGCAGGAAQRGEHPGCSLGRDRLAIGGVGQKLVYAIEGAGSCAAQQSAAE